MFQLRTSAQTFILSNARLLERHLFAFHFHDGDPQPVVSALLAYQNADGGFGNALEPDKRTATSQPIDQEFALRVLDTIGFDHHIAMRVCAFLETITTSTGGVPFVLSTVRDAPRAGWWHTDEDHPSAAITPTAGIAGLLHKHAIHHPWLERATAFCWQQIEQNEVSSEHNGLSAIAFLEHVPDRERAEHAFVRIGNQLVAGGHIKVDPHAPGYGLTPLDFAPVPQSLGRRLFDDATIEAHLDALAKKQQDDGGWPISWPAVSPACELEYRGIITINALKTLTAYGYRASRNG